MFAIGDKEWPGLSKMVEEFGEALTDAGKLMGTGGKTDHWDGRGDLKTRLENEIADSWAASQFFAEHNGFNLERMSARAAQKFALFETWHKNGKSS